MMYRSIRGGAFNLLVSIPLFRSSNSARFLRSMFHQAQGLTIFLRESITKAEEDSTTSS